MSNRFIPRGFGSGSSSSSADSFVTQQPLLDDSFESDDDAGSMEDFCLTDSEEVTRHRAGQLFGLLDLAEEVWDAVVKPISQRVATPAVRAKDKLAKKLNKSSVRMPCYSFQRLFVSGSLKKHINISNEADYDLLAIFDIDQSTFDMDEPAGTALFKSATEPPPPPIFFATAIRRALAKNLCNTWIDLPAVCYQAPKRHSAGRKLKNWDILPAFSLDDTNSKFLVPSDDGAGWQETSVWFPTQIQRRAIRILRLLNEKYWYVKFSTLGVRKFLFEAVIRTLPEELASVNSTGVLIHSILGELGLAIARWEEVADPDSGEAITDFNKNRPTANLFAQQLRALQEMRQPDSAWLQFLSLEVQE